MSVHSQAMHIVWLDRLLCVIGISCSQGTPIVSEVVPCVKKATEENPALRRLPISSTHVAFHDGRRRDFPNVIFLLHIHAASRYLVAAPSAQFYRPVKVKYTLE